jgi:hypothetical protein
MDKAFTNYFKELSTTFPNAIDDTLKKEFPARISLINSFTT